MMAKGKKKAFKLKEYKVPQENFIVVVNPWGLPERLDGNTKLNEIAAWFELLFKKEYPDARVREFFFQKTHRNIIVELPAEVDINKYLGAYHYSDFHRNISPADSPTLYIYEYRFATFGNPSNKNWTGIIPTNTNIPVGLLQVFKDPFPLPSPAPRPPSDTPYARPIPQEIQNILSTMRVMTTSTSMEVSGVDSGHLSPQFPTPAPNVASCSSFTPPSKATGSLFTPYEPPSHYVSHVEASRARIDKQVKMDPYEEEEVEKSHLRSLSGVKDESSNEAVKFLDSFLSNVKSEEVVPSPSPSRDSKLISRTASNIDGEEEDYKPSADLLALFNTLDEDVVVKSEVETEIMDDEDYRPSNELLAAFADLSDNTESYIRVKQEPADFAIRPIPIKHERNSEDDQEAVLFRKRLKKED